MARRTCGAPGESHGKCCFPRRWRVRRALFEYRPIQLLARISHAPG